MTLPNASPSGPPTADCFPCGGLSIAVLVRDGAVAASALGVDAERTAAAWQTRWPALRAAPLAGIREAVAAYFGGDPSALGGIALWPPEGTAFQQTIWRLLAEIPFGRLATYGELAARAGNPKGARAVGQALNRNPLPLFLPCHRVLGSGGTMTGFGCGLPVKETLLRVEGWQIAGGRLLNARGRGRTAAE